MINYNKQHIDNQDIVSVTKILKSDFITQGPTIEKFENALKKILEQSIVLQSQTVQPLYI